MRPLLALLAFSWVFLLGPSVQADASQEPLKLDSYRLKALLPAICSQIGGTIVYGAHTHDCKLPTVSSKIPSSSATTGRALPVSVGH
jgi:hypothetical protein